MPPASATARSVVPGPQGIPDFLDLRRSAESLGTDAEFLYWADGGHFEGEGDKTKYFKDGSLFRRPLAGGAVETLATGFSAPGDIAITATQVILGDTDGLIGVPKVGGAATRIWPGERVKKVAAAGEAVWFVVDGHPNSLRRLGRESALPVGYGEALAGFGDIAVVGGLGGWNLSDMKRGRVWLSGEASPIELDGRHVLSLALDAEAIYVGDEGELIRLPRKGEVPAVLGVARDEVRGVTVDGETVFYIAHNPGPGGAIRSVSARGGASPVELVVREATIWLLAVSARDLFWVESDPVKDPWTREPMKYRLGHAGR